jgi:Tfp pilus assembly protein PilN
MGQSARSMPTRPLLPQPLRQLWKGPLVAGLCFGLAYGLTQRLLSLKLVGFARSAPKFEQQVFPGTSLDTLQQRFGGPPLQLKLDKPLREMDRQLQERARLEQAKAEAAKKKEQVEKLTQPAAPSADSAAAAPEPPQVPVPPEEPVSQP